MATSRGGRVTTETSDSGKSATFKPAIILPGSQTVEIGSRVQSDASGSEGEERSREEPEQDEEGRQRALLSDRERDYQVISLVKMEDPESETNACITITPQKILQGTLQAALMVVNCVAPPVALSPYLPKIPGPLGEMALMEAFLTNYFIISGLNYGTTHIFGTDPKLKYKVKLREAVKTVGSAVVSLGAVAGLGYGAGVGENAFMNHTFPNASAAFREFEIALSFALLMDPLHLLGSGSLGLGVGVSIFKLLKYISRRDTSGDEYETYEKDKEPTLHGLQIAGQYALRFAGDFFLTEMVLFYLRTFGSYQALQAANSPPVGLVLFLASDWFLQSLSHLANHPSPIMSLIQPEACWESKPTYQALDGGVEDQKKGCAKKPCTPPAVVKMSLKATLFVGLSYGLAGVTCLMPWILHRNTVNATTVLNPPVDTHFPVGPFCNQDLITSRLALDAVAGGGALAIDYLINHSAKALRGCATTLFSSCRNKTPTDGYEQLLNDDLVVQVETTSEHRAFRGLGLGGGRDGNQ